MSSNHADHRTEPPVPSRSWSITMRLTVLYSLATLLVLLATLGYSHWVMVTNFRDASMRMLADELQEVRVLLRDHPDEPKAVEAEVVWEDPAEGKYRHYLRVLDASGQLLVETPEMSTIAPMSIFPSPVGVNEDGLQGMRRREHRGAWLVLGSAWGEVGQAGGEKRIIQAVFDVTWEEQIIADYRKRIALFLVVGTIGAAFLGWAVSRHGLQPLLEIQRAAQRVTATHLHERVGSARWPRELISLAESFDAMLGRLEDSFSRLSQFSANLAHELRTPINNLRGETEVALAKSRSAEEYREVLESSLEEYERLTRMIEGLLFLARAEDPATRIERSQLDVRREIDAVLEFHEPLAEEQEIELKAEGSGSIEADSMLLRRALANLVSNSLRHTDRGGRVCVRVDAANGTTTRVIVEDNGRGIPRNHLPHLCDRFYRADASRAKDTEGTGLGLAIVKSIMELHHGSIRIDSELGQGTTVTLEFPTRETK